MLEVKPIQDEDDCILKCRGTQQCEYYTHNADKKFCYLFDGCQNTSISNCENCVTGFKECPLSSECDTKGRCEGILLMDFIEASGVSCLERCKNYDTNDGYCGWYTYQSDLQMCFIFDDCLQLDQTCQTCTSGRKYCRQTYATLPPCSPIS